MTEKTSNATIEKTWEPTADAESSIILAMGSEKKEMRP